MDQDTADRDWIGTGRFGELTLLSRKALRLYDDTGLLKPAQVDPRTGYRRYAPDQVEPARLVSLLRAAGMPLSGIREVLAADRDDAMRLLDSHAHRLAEDAASGRSLLARVRARLQEEQHMDDIATRTAEDRPVLSLMLHVGIDQMDDEVEAARGRLVVCARECGLRATGDAFGVFHRPVTQESSGPLEVCLPVDDLPSAAPPDHVRAYRLPGGPVAELVVTGRDTDFPAVLGAYDAVAHWIDDSGHRQVGPPREVWPADGSLVVSWPFTRVP